MVKRVQGSSMSYGISIELQKAEKERQLSEVSALDQLLTEADAEALEMLKFLDFGSLSNLHTAQPVDGIYFKTSCGTI